MATTNLVPGGQVHLTPANTGVRNALFSQFTFGLTSRPSSAKSTKALKLGKNFSNISLYRSSGATKKGSRTGSFVVKCEASTTGRIAQQEFMEMAWKAIVSSPEVAKENKHQIGETEHLMKALLEQKNGLARSIFFEAGVDYTRLLEATDKYIQRQPKVLSESAGSMLGRDLEALIQLARDYKEEFGDSFVSVEHLVLAFTQDNRFGKQLFSDFQLSERTLRSAIRAVRGRQSVIDQVNTMQFHDGSSDVELRLMLRGTEDPSSKEIFVDADESSLVVRIHRPGSITTLMETQHLYDRIKPGETIWYLDDDQLVINMKKQDPELKWPDIVESWESLSVGVLQLLKGTSIYLVGRSSEINYKVAQELAVGLGYTPLDTKSLLETFAKRSIDSWVAAEGPNSVAEAEQAVLESLSSHVRAVVATLGGQHGAAGREDKWRHLCSGFTVWLSESEATDEDSAKDEAQKQVFDGSEAYSKADVVVKLGGWDAAYAKTVAQASLSALKQLILSDKKLPGKKSLYIRLGCRGDWPNIKPPGWDPSSGADVPSAVL